MYIQRENNLQIFCMEIIDHTKKTKLNYKFYYNPLPKEAAESEIQ